MPPHLKGAQLMVVPPIVNGRSPRSGMARRRKLKVAQVMVVQPKVAGHKKKTKSGTTDGHERCFPARFIDGTTAGGHIVKI